jgi:hypothetical protein
MPRGVSKLCVCVCDGGGAQLRLLAVAVPRIRYHLLIIYIHEVGDWKNGVLPIMTAFWIHICEERIANITQARRHDSEMYGIMRHLCLPLDMGDTKLLVNLQIANRQESPSFALP